MNLGENIYRFRTERNMSQGDLADALEVSRQSVSKWENNTAIPELEKLLKMSEVFGVTLDQLVGKEPPRAAATEIVVRSGMEPRQMVGIVLLSIGLVGFLILTLWAGFLLSCLFALPLIVIGTVLLASGNNLLFKCCWALFAVYAPLDYFFILNYIGYGAYIALGLVAVWFAVLVIWSAVMLRRGKLTDGSKKLMIGCAVFAIIFALILVFVVSQRILYADLQNSAEEIETYFIERD